MDRRTEALAGGLGLLATVAGIAVLVVGVRRDAGLLTTAGILVLVAGLVGLRVRQWVRKERVLRQVGHDLHVEE